MDLSSLFICTKQNILRINIEFCPLAVVFHCYVDVVLRDAKRFYVPDADKQRKKFDKIISHETHLL